MSYVEGVDVQRCTVCGWKQSSGRGETILFCPDCGGTSWANTGNGGQA